MPVRLRFVLARRHGAKRAKVVQERKSTMQISPSQSTSRVVVDHGTVARELAALRVVLPPEPRLNNAWF